MDVINVTMFEESQPKKHENKKCVMTIKLKACLFSLFSHINRLNFQSFPIWILLLLFPSPPLTTRDSPPVPSLCSNKTR